MGRAACRTVAEELPSEILAHYARGQEAARLLTGKNQLELARTQELLVRHLPPPPRVVLDVGGGPGVYACWLARQGYAVHLVDAVPLHVEQARAASARQPEHAVASLRVGDARRLDEADASVDAVLLLGPLYHLTERADRLTALREARRVLKPAALVFAAAVGRFASLFDGLFHEMYADPDFAAIVERDLRDGQHRNPTPRDYFTTAFFHRPDELAGEVREAGFAVEDVVGVEGPGGLLPDFARRWADPDERARLLWVARVLEREPSLLGMSDHLLAVARRS
jgi:ubiquinone/menaquinone biosynthesis C-methylase UbiE